MRSNPKWRFAFVAAAFAFMALSLPGMAQAGEGNFSLYPRIGIVFPSQDPANGFKSSSGFQLGVMGLYGVNRWLSFGGMVEWERTGISNNWLTYPDYTSIGHFHTVSMLPVVEFRYRDDELSVSPYLITGLGVNLNFLERSSALAATGTTASFDPTFAYRVAGGVDIYASKHVGFRLELGWKLNKGKVTVKSPLLPGPAPLKADFDASAVTASVGILLGV